MKWAILVLSGAAAGCALEFVAPPASTAPPEPAQLRILISADGATDSLAIEAMLYPGRDSVGIRAILSDVLLVGTEAVPGESIPPGPVRLYRWSSSLAAAPPGLRIIGPVLVGTSPANRGISMPLVNRAAGRDITIDRGSDLDIPLVIGTADSAAGVSAMTWWFRLLADTGVAVILAGQGAPPAVLALPAGVFELVSSDSCVAYLETSVSASVGYSRDVQLESNAYTLTASAFSRLDWIVHLTTPTP